VQSFAQEKERMLECSGQGELEGKKENPFFRLESEKRMAARDNAGRASRKQRVDDDALKRMEKRRYPLSDSAPIRRQKVEEAKRKKQNGDYDSQEVYRKIADRLIDLFGI
jgi:anti-sigma28 factor (negative regulator of flagellin synthesis)